jgi:malonyl-CoA/methylmalonyl-CoA synthetase
MNANLYALFESRFPQDRSACCIETSDGLFYSWRDLERATAKIANLLASLKLPAGARIAVQVEKSPEALMLYLATIRAGYVYLPLNTAYRAAEIEYFLSDAEPAVVVCTPQNFGWISKLAFKADARHVFTLSDDRHGSLLARAMHFPDHFDTVLKQPHDLAAILYTSGTTGRSKGAMLTHDNLASNALTLHDYWRWQPGDVLLHALPLFHVHGLFVACHGALLNGSRMIFLPKFDNNTVIHHLARSTIFMGVPTYYVRLLADPAFDQSTCANIRLFISGSAPLLADTFNQFIARTGKTILERYGMSETLMLTSNPYEGARIGGTVGLPLPGVSVRTVTDANTSSPAICATNEIGDIQVKGPNVFQGYWRMPEKTAEEFTSDGYFKTGDVGKFDENGYLSIVGRSKDLIISGGYNVYPKEIESFVDEIDGVAESAVIGVPHVDFGEAVVAVIVPKPDASLTEDQITAALKASIANFKVPKRIVFLPELPRNVMGKVQKSALRQQFQQLLNEAQ